MKKETSLRGVKSKTYYLLKNAFKSVLRNKIQMTGLIILIFLISTIFSLVLTTVQRAQSSYQNFINDSNLHQFVIDLRKVTKPNNVSNEAVENLDRTAYAQWAVEQAKSDLIVENPAYDFTSEYREGRMIFREINGKESLFKVIAYDTNNTIDKIVITEGRSLSKEPLNEVVLTPEYAKRNGYKVGDYICLQSAVCNVNDKTNNALKIIGLGSSADFSYLQLNETTPIPNQKREALAYVHPAQFGLLPFNSTNNLQKIKWQYIGSQEKISLTSSADQEIYFTGQWKDSVINKADAISKLQKKIEKYFFSTDARTKKNVFDVTDSSYEFSARVTTIKLILTAYRYTAIVLLVMAVTIAGVIIALITKKRVENSRAQLGILKSLGHSSFNLAITFIVYPFIASLIGGILGFILGMSFQIPIMNIFNSYFIIPFGSFSFNWIALIVATFGVFAILGTITGIASAIYVRGNPLKLLHPQENASLLLVSRWFSYLNRGKNFDTRFRWAIFSKSLGKMMTVFTTMFLATILLTFSISAPKILTDMRDATYQGIKYNSITEYQTPVWNSPLSTYGSYNLEYDRTKLGVDPNFFSNRILREYQFENVPGHGDFKRILPDGRQVIRLSNLNYALFDFEFYFSATLSKLDSSGQLEQLKSLACGLVIDNWASLPPEEKAKYFMGDCLVAGTTKKAPYFVRSKLQNLVNSLKEIETKLAIKILQAGDLTNSTVEYTNGNPISTQVNADFLESINTITDDENYLKRVQIAYQVFGLIRERLNNGTGDWELNRYMGIAQTYLREIVNEIGLERVFNIQFALTTYNPEEDELATSFTPIINKINNVANVKMMNMKAYGIERTSKLHELIDRDNNNLLEAMYNVRKSNLNTIPIVINQTLARHLQIKQSDILEVATNKPTLYTTKDNPEGRPVNLNKWFFDQDTPQLFSAVENSDIVQSNYLYSSFPGNGTPGTSSPSEMYNALLKNNVFIRTNSNDIVQMKVIGIQEGYGDARIFLPKNDADIAMGYFTQEEGQWVGSAHFNKIKDIFNFHRRITNLDGELDPTKDAENFKGFFGDITEDEAVANAFPLFNTKFSRNRDIQDITESISLAQSYGDFSPVTLQGEAYLQDGRYIQRFLSFAQSAITYALPIAAQQTVFDEVKGIADSLLIAFMIIALLISSITILVTSNLIITENRRLIATMKVLGYNDYEVNFLTLGIYLPIIFIAFIIGFPISWFSIGAFINFLALNTIWVMPFYFSWWVLIVILLLVLILYLVTFAVGGYLLKRMKPIDALKIDD